MADYKYKCLNCGKEHEYTKEEVYKLYDQDKIQCPICDSDRMLMVVHPKVEEPDQEQIDKELFEAYGQIKDE